ncbi:MAG: MFS transporter [Ornithinimicrobium sp.]|uniref:MFS transporter n=1 Tax=Ornithinimicrobium sp. TaxID=1977084 RepID=UPI0026DF8263|nr:MFS transporter [Ornithinimicrobium sp.]MDO5739707.1 MFS transporter [Ornithinimicrobium sp.]
MREGVAPAAPASSSGARRGARSLLTVASLAVALAAADTYVVVLALTDMMAGVGVGIEALQKGTPIISGFLLGYIAVLPLIGRVSDLVDRRRILLWCLVVFVVGSAVTAVAVDLPVMVTGRTLQGLGGGGLVPATLALVADLWPRGERGLPLGVVGAVQELGAVIGPLLGAVVLAVAGWREIFWLNVLLGVMAFVGILTVRVDEGQTGRGAAPGEESAASTPRPGSRAEAGRGGARLRTGAAYLSGALAAALTVLTLWAPEGLTTSIALGGPFVPFDLGSAAAPASRVLTPIGVGAGVAWLLLATITARRWLPLLVRADVVGASFIAVALGAVVLTFSTANPETEVLGPWGLWLLPIAALAAVAFVVRQQTARHPLISAGVVRARVWPSLIVSFLVGAAIVAIVVDVPLLSRLTQGTDETDAALVLVRFLVAVPVGAVLGGALLRRVGPGLVAGPGLALAAVGIFAMAQWDRASLDHLLATTLALVAAGVGIGLAIAPVNDAALADAHEDGHGTVSSLVVVARMTGMVVGLALLTSLGLRRFQLEVGRLADPTDTNALLGAAVVQVQTVLLGAGIAAAVAAVLALSLGSRPVGHGIPSSHDLPAEPRGRSRG